MSTPTDKDKFVALCEYGRDDAERFWPIWWKAHEEDLLRPREDWRPIARRFAEAYAAHQLAERDKDLAANERDWNVIAQELGCENTREEMVKQIRILRGKL